MAAGSVSRRDFVRAGLLITPAIRGFPAIVQSEAARPSMAQGVACGDVSPGRAVIWSRSDRPSRMLVEYSTSDKFENVLRRSGPAVRAAAGHERGRPS